MISWGGMSAGTWTMMRPCRTLSTQRTGRPPTMSAVPADRARTETIARTNPDRSRGDQQTLLTRPTTSGAAPDWSSDTTTSPTADSPSQASRTKRRFTCPSASIRATVS